VEYPQTTDRLTKSSQALFELVKGRNLVLYPDAEMRSHALNAVAIESARGWRIAKEKSSRKIDAIAALSFAVVDVLHEMPSGAFAVPYRDLAESFVSPTHETRGGLIVSGPADLPDAQDLFITLRRGAGMSDGRS
jgi:phage terminase large subunit-like protein